MDFFKNINEVSQKTRNEEFLNKKLYFKEHIYMENSGLLRYDYKWEDVILDAHVPNTSGIEEDNVLPFSQCIYT